MTKSIDFNPLASHEPLLKPAGPAAPERDAALWQADFAERFAAKRAGRLSNLLAQALETRLKDLASAIEAVAWPRTNGPLAEARLAVPEDSLAGYLTAEARSGDAAVPYDRLVSRGFSPGRSAPVAAGSYALTLGLGRERETVQLDVAKGDTAREVLAGLAEAVNAARLPVEARVLTQTSPGSRLPGSTGRGDLLVLSVNEARSAEALSVRDASGHLARALDLAALPPARGPAATRRYDLVGSSPAKPTTYVSRDFDPGATTDLPAGTYTIGWSFGAAAGSIEVPVRAGQTWDEVLQTLASRLNSSQDKARAQSARVERPYYDPRLADMASRRRVELGVTAGAGRPGERLSLSEDRKLSPDGTSGLLERLGLTVTASPGVDGRLVVNGDTLVRSPGNFERDAGRLTMDLEQAFGDRRTLRVEPLSQALPQALQAVFAAYGELTGLLGQDAELFDQELAASFTRPAADLSAELAGDGVTVLAQGRSARLDPRRFLAALAADPDGLRQRLLGPGGLISVWETSARQALAAGTKDLLAPASAFTARLGRAEAALANDLSALLLDLLG